MNTSLPSTAVEEQTDTPSPRMEDGLNEDKSTRDLAAFAKRLHAGDPIEHDDANIDHCSRCNAAYAIETMLAVLQSLRTELGAARREASTLLTERRALLQAGNPLSNVAFNLRQRDHLDADERETLHACQTAWDAATRSLTPDADHVAARSPSPEAQS